MLGLPRLSVVIPTFNAASFVSEALTSVASVVDGISSEILVQDDASSDDTVKVVRSFARNTGTLLSLIVNKHNIGAAANRNLAIARARGEYILMLDADNVLDVSSSKELIDSAFGLDFSYVAASFSKVEFFRDTFADAYSWEMNVSRLILPEALSDLSIPAVSSGNWIFRRSHWLLCGGYPAFARSWDTHLFALRLLTHGDVLVVPNTFYHHRLRKESNFLQHTQSHRLWALRKVLPELERFLPAQTQSAIRCVQSNRDAQIFLRGHTPLGSQQLIRTSPQEPRHLVRRFVWRMKFLAWHGYHATLRHLKSNLGVR